MINYITTPFKWFFKLAAASGLILLIFTIIALVISNSNFSYYYFDDELIERFGLIKDWNVSEVTDMHDIFNNINLDYLRLKLIVLHLYTIYKEYPR